MAAPEDPQNLGPWERDRILGTGGFGIVTLWKNNNTQERVAIKKCRWGMDNAMTLNHKERWAREVVIMQRLSHPNVVRAVSVPSELQSLASELPLLCMEFCSGGDLRQILNKPENCCGLREAEVRSLLSDIKAAVQYLHSQRITHRDLKPENIVLQERPNCPMIYKLIDLGYAKELESSSVCSSFVGTMQYLAPEFFTSSGYSSSVDYWSLGLVSHEAITGVRPFLPNASSPVEWMPKVEKKSTNDICVYQLPGTKDIKYSQQLFIENHISRCLREELEKWLRLALEWNPKKRGRSQLDNKLMIFSMLDEILNKKIVTVFSVTTLGCHSYQVDSATAVSTLQLWIERDTKQPAGEQLLLLPSGKQLTLDNMAIDCWNPAETSAMLYVFSRKSFSLPYVKVAERVPSLVRWLMENPKEALEYHHQKHVWRHAVFFLRQEYDLFQLFLEAYAVKMLSLLEQSFELTQLESAVSVDVEQLSAIQKMSSDLLEFDNKCYGRHLGGITLLAGLGKLMTGWATEVNSSAQRVASYQEAYGVMKVRVQDAHRCLGSLQEYDPQGRSTPGQDDLISFERWMTEGYKCYDNIRKRKDKSSRHQSLDMARIVYNCFKQIDISLRNEAFDAHLKQLMRCEEEITSLHKALATLKQQVLRSRQEVMRCQYLRQKETWALVRRLATQKEQDLATQSTLSLSTPSPHTLAPSPNFGFQTIGDFVVPPRPRDPSPLPKREAQVPVYPSPTSSPGPSSPSSPNKPTTPNYPPTPNHSTTHNNSLIPNKPTTPNNTTTTNSQISLNNQTQPPSSATSLKGFDTSAQQTPLNNTPTIPGAPKPTFLLQLPTKSHLETDSLIQDNINIRYAMQDSIVSFTQCSNAITANDFDWSYLDSVNK